MTDLKKAAQQALEALQIGYDSAKAEAAQYHAAMAGYRPHRHAEMDADVQKIAQTITALKAALEQREQEPELRELLIGAAAMAVAAERKGEYQGASWVADAVLEQPEQAEPVAWQYKKEGGGIFVSDQCPADVDVWNDIEWSKPLYTHPPRREWQVLTDEEIDSLWRKWVGTQRPNYSFTRAIEAKLKEKNA